MIGIGGAISAGVFVMLGHAVTLAGTTVIIALILCGIINLFTMCSYAELGAALPKAGGEYTFSKAAFGGFFSFFLAFLLTRYAADVLTGRTTLAYFIVAVGVLVIINVIIHFFLPEKR